MINAYNGSDTEEVFNVTQDGAAYNLDTESITEVKVYTCSGVSISSDDGHISWSADELTIKFGMLSLSSGDHICKIKFYTAAKTNGFVVQSIIVQMTC